MSLSAENINFKTGELLANLKSAFSEFRTRNRLYTFTGICMNKKITDGNGEKIGTALASLPTDL